MTRTVEWIVVHTAAAANAQGQPVYQTAADIDRYHRQHNGWRKGGYHAVVQKDGHVARDPTLTRTDEEEGAHARSFNERSLGVCVAGHGDLADFLPEQVDGLVELCVRWCIKYRLTHENVIGHRETADHGGPSVDKTCPGLKVNMMRIRDLVRRELEGVKCPPTLEERVAALETAVHELNPGWLP